MAPGSLPFFIKSTVLCLPVCRCVTTPTCLSARRHALLSTCPSSPTSCPSSSTVTASSTDTTRPKTSKCFHTIELTDTLKDKEHPIQTSFSGHLLIWEQQRAIISIIAISRIALGRILLLLALSEVTLSTAFSSDYSKCCCLPSLQTTSSSRSFTGKVSTCEATYTKPLMEPEVCLLIRVDLFHLTFIPQIRPSASLPPTHFILFVISTFLSCFSFLCLFSYPSFRILFLILLQVTTKEAVSPSCASSTCPQLRCPISCCKAP